MNVDPLRSRRSAIPRVEVAKNERIKAFEQDKRRLIAKVDEIQALVDRPALENARLKEAHAHAVASNILATILIVIGSAGIRLATFANGASKVVASVGVAVLMSGVLVLNFPAFRGRATQRVRPS